MTTTCLQQSAAATTLAALGYNTSRRTSKRTASRVQHHCFVARPTTSTQRLGTLFLHAMFEIDTWQNRAKAGFKHAALTSFSSPTIAQHFEAAVEPIGVLGWLDVGARHCVLLTVQRPKLLALAFARALHAFRASKDSFSSLRSCYNSPGTRPATCACFP